jgi:gamma-glutamyl:cysteine ligase YbdK (ATP-grasp superfamily)
VRELASEMIEQARPYARELGCEERLVSLDDLIESGGGAGLQRRAHGVGETNEVLRVLMSTAARCG